MSINCVQFLFAESIEVDGIGTLDRKKEREREFEWQSIYYLLEMQLQVVVSKFISTQTSYIT